MWLNVRNGTTRSMPLNAPLHTVGWMFDSKGQARVAITAHQGRRAIHWRGPGQDGWRLLAEGTALLPATRPRV